MWVTARILGASATRTLEERASTHVLVVGSDKYTRADLAKVGCFNYLAAANLSRVIKDAFPAKSLKQLYADYSVDAFVLPSIGPIALAVLGAGFELAGVGGDYPLDAWVKAHATDASPGDVVFDTLKEHERKRLDAKSERRKRHAPASRRAFRRPDVRRGAPLRATNHARRS